MSDPNRFLRALRVQSSKGMQPSDLNTQIDLGLRYDFDIYRVATEKLASSPLFLLNTTAGRLAYNHNYKFSTEAGFDLDIHELGGALKFMAYDFVASTYPDHAPKLKEQLNSYAESHGNEEVWYLVQHHPSTSSLLQASQKKKVVPCSIENLVKVSTGERKHYYEYLEGLSYLRSLGTREAQVNESKKSPLEIPDLFPHRLDPKTSLSVENMNRLFFTHPLKFPHTLVDAQQKLFHAFKQIRLIPPEELTSKIGLFCHPTIITRRGIAHLEYLTIHMPYNNHSYIFDVATIGWDLLTSHAEGFHGLRFRRILGAAHTTKIFYNFDEVEVVLRQSRRLQLQNRMSLQHEGNIVSGDLDFDSAVESAAQSSVIGWIYAKNLRYLQQKVGSEENACLVRPMGKLTQKLLATKAVALRCIFLDQRKKFAQLGASLSVEQPSSE
ncbi:hypothetical protein GLAREA_04292 [Glarea lozoyensis ATCC 20868]|uniref:Uncharacterized protein n=1 Tax=Glarea lozoyensis (strain ATCC 20868 / MF5171) TaxID=1116229 RepID=S3D5Y8_GLAL2|nr:uncharacterized protein GLAREA_04292 [Glarea lozoyensis ATCC 20868]EPE27501.1 hypothetical protein GLAREA_04292 [Glarea lozoyensis ATCC 20868]